jgi:uncharacterized membrane protein YgdD (TMEM256/DUF423 family)
MNWSAIGALYLAVGVILGAFGAHSLRAHLDADAMAIWEKAVFYHFIHALGILIVPTVARPPLSERVCMLLALGILFFSGSLYILAVSGVRTLGAVTPFGGIAFIAAWIWLAIGLFRSGK